MLVHRPVRVFSYLCQGKKPPAGSDTATRRIAFKRLLRLNRKSEVCRTLRGYAFSPLSCLCAFHFLCVLYITHELPLARSRFRRVMSVSEPSLHPLCVPFQFSLFRMRSYILSANEKQAVVTGYQQRDSVTILPFILAGLFGPLGEEDPDGVFAGQLDAEHAAAAAATNAAGYDAIADDHAAALVGKNFVFDWAAYHDVWGGTSVHIAVTCMFAEDVVLYSRIAGRTTFAVPPPMTRTERYKIAEQAKDCCEKLRDSHVRLHRFRDGTQAAVPPRRCDQVAREPSKWDHRRQRE